MLLFLQNVLCCFLYILPVKLAVRDNGLNCLYFYPKEFIAEAEKRGLADKDATMEKGKRFMILFCIFLYVVVVLIVGVWNRAADFKTAYWQSYMFAVVMNWFDGICIDRLWVGHDKVWQIKGMEGLPYVKPWKTVLTKRGLATVLYLVIALAVAAPAMLLANLF